MFNKSTALILLSLLTLGCSNQSPVTVVKSKLAPRVTQDWLSDAHAQLRRQQVSDVRYNLDFDISQTDKFSGITTIEFNNHLLSDDLTIDFSQGVVDKVSVNGAKVDFAYNRFFITVAKGDLKLGKNAIKIHYNHKYSDNGSGLYRYHDSTDDSTYLYTHFEPYEANKLFPGFDQPNLRASYKVNVTAPAHWSVVTSVRETEVVEKGEYKLWHFPESANFGTYVFPLHAGPYKVWEDKYEDIPLRLFARKSLAQYIETERMFDVTKKGLAFFNDYFDYRYPFGKYDQLIVPDFNISGMENVAAVTYSESIVSRSKLTQSQRERISSLLLHELSHMWFGDLVTVDWWSNLWLKESFATYMANVALGETGLSDNAWNRFYTSVKQRAYRADASVTTHAIQTPVSDTKNGVASFDAVTYSKGASVLNQLTHHLGDETFKEGIRLYFKKYAWQATKLPDFINTLGVVAGEDLSQWTQDWLYKAGTNRVNVSFDCKNDKISHFVIEQSYPKEHPHLRQHSLNIGLYALNSEFKLIKTQPVKVVGKQTVVEALVGEQCPDMVYPNHDDWGFVKVILDEKTRNNVTRAIPLVKDPMLRAMFYQSLWDLVDDQQMSLTAYIDLVMVTLTNEKDLKVLSLVMNKLRDSASYLNLFNGEQYPLKSDYLYKLERFFLLGLVEQPSGSDHQKAWFRAAVKTTQSSEGQTWLNRALNVGLKTAGLEIDQDMRWDIIIQLARLGSTQTKDLLAREKKADPSHRGVLSAIAADAAYPQSETKRRWIEEFEKTTGRLTAKKQKVAMENLFPSNQTDLLAPFSDRLLNDLIAFDVDRDQKLMATMVYSIMPRLCTEQSVVKLQRAIDANPQLGLIALKGLKEVQQSDKTCVVISRVH